MPNLETQTPGDQSGFLADRILRKENKIAPEEAVEQTSSAVSEEKANQMIQHVATTAMQNRWGRIASGILNARRAEAADVVQEALLYARDSIKRGVYQAEKGSLEGWIESKVRSLSKNRHVAASRHKAVLDRAHSVDEVGEDEKGRQRRPREIKDERPNVLHSMVQPESGRGKLYEMLKKHVDELPEGLRQVMLLVLDEGLTDENIAERLGMDLREVRKLHRDGLKRLQRIINPAEEEEAAA